MSEILVVGAGVSGLTASILLAESGHQVRVVSDKPPLATTSAVAAAFWYPYLVEPADCASRWSIRSLDYFTELAEDQASGVFRQQARALYQQPAPDPPWHSAVEGYEPLSRHELPPSYEAGFRFVTFVVQMTVYLPYLHERALAMGVRFESRRVSDRAELIALGPRIINCTGLGSREMLGDDQLFAMRGQISRVPVMPISDLTFAPDNATGPVHVVPRRGDCILGGTKIHSVDLTPDPATRDEIARKCLALEPRLDAQLMAEHTEMLVGLRPCRTSIRLEREDLGPGRYIIHNYGHGGAGVTLSWGCAEEVLRLLG